MHILNGISLGLIAILQFYFFYLETFMWETPKGLKIFRMTESQAIQTSPLASNQGVYNGLLGLGLVASILLDPDRGFVLASYILSFIFVVGVYGSITVFRKILFIQAIPAVIALAILWLSHAARYSNL